MKSNFFPAIRLTVVCLLFFSGIYTLIVLGLAQLAPNKGKGEIVTQKGKVHYANVGQTFSNDNYFWSRPSAVGYNAAGAGGSNKGPSNPDYLAEVQTRIDTFLVHHPGIKKTDIPSDIVTASGAGLDPNISVEAANIQVGRVAKVRGLTEGVVQQLVLAATEKPLLGLFGTEKINVLKLNIALDNLK
ncbi:K(+)-transporting ATPase subunit C [Pedobacter sp. SL55]|uniref:K(+)-transporting ATPase subunit C n=1 Tax=Pedobacter sp. SL55 TaxID=2995161 RepID=UPI00226F4536|nr:K(+)-transporting ATPase subunit C [Pedobacter sp. SL55]WAC39539.1 K(+)-transporting ATPase subunit C [Pedobacter sp. SL55]